VAERPHRLGHADGVRSHLDDERLAHAPGGLVTLRGRDTDRGPGEPGDVLVADMTDPDWEPIMKRASAIVTNRGGLELVDEVDSGIYYQNLAASWQAIDVASRTAGVQVFATTHSLECVQSALSAFHDLGAEDFRLYRMERTEGGLRAVAYDRETAAAALELGLEVR